MGAGVEHMPESGERASSVESCDRDSHAFRIRSLWS